MIHLVQLRSGEQRCVALVEEPHLRVLHAHPSVHSLVLAALESGVALGELIARLATRETIAYDEVDAGRSRWSLLPPFDHPQEPARCLVTGTGLTHLGSARDRSAMHNVAEDQLTDSMKMFRWGTERGRPADGEIGVAPEWFYKGNATILRAPGDPLLVPDYAEDGGEEAEIAALYVNDRDGTPVRVGFAAGNEFSDHVFEKRNYLNLAGSKIRTCAIGPELVVGATFERIAGRVSIRRGTETVWTREIASGETEMCHSLRNIEHHHFKFESHRRPGDAHIHFLGAHSLSFGAGIRLQDGDLMEVAFDGFGRPLRNPLRVAPRPASLTRVRILT